MKQWIFRIAVMALCIIACIWAAEKGEIETTWTKTMPEVGQVWIGKADDPWAESFEMTITDVNDGWVRYKFFPNDHNNHRVHTVSDWTKAFTLKETP